METEEAESEQANGEVAGWQHASQSEQNARAPQLWTCFRQTFAIS
jgi:hypothetical protein